MQGVKDGGGRRWLYNACRRKKADDCIHRQTVYTREIRTQTQHTKKKKKANTKREGEGERERERERERMCENVCVCGWVRA